MDGPRVLHPRLDTDQIGWDWLSLQLDDNTELMLYRLRHKDGSVDPFSSGTYVDAAGKSTFLGASRFHHDAARRDLYQPSHKGDLSDRVAGNIPSLRLGPAAQAAPGSQELASDSNAGLSYWEGAITISGTHERRADHRRRLSGDDGLRKRHGIEAQKSRLRKPCPREVVACF